MRVVFVAIMIITSLAILVGSHLFLYYSAVKFFNITGLGAKRIIFYSLLFLSLSFIFSFTLLHYYSNFFTHAYYILTSVWLALMVNLFFACIAGWLIYWMAGWFKFGLRMYIFGFAIIIVSLVVVIYGYRNAQNPRIKNITVKINNLPAQWQGKTAVQISDIHAGVIHNTKFIDRMVRQLDGINKDIVFITGDYFDSRDCDHDAFTAPLKNIKADKGIYFVSGNHERYVGEEKVFPALEKAGVKILMDEVVNVDGMNIIGVDYPGDMMKINYEPLFQKVNPDEFNVLLYHEPRLIPVAKQYGVDLQLAGHTHKGQMWPFAIFTKMIYGKYHIGLNEEDNYTIYTTTGVGTWGPPVRTGNKPEIVVIKLEKK